MENIEQPNLAEAVRSGHEGAVEELVRTYQDRLFGYALRMLRDQADAQEVTQDTFVRAYRTLAFEYDEERCRTLVLGAWLFRITRNLALNRIRRRQSRREEPLPDNEENRTAGSRFVSTAASDPAVQLQSAERQIILEDAISLLESEARDLILLRFVEGMAYAEIADVAGVTESAARGKVFRALRKLRRFLGEVR